MNLLDYFDGARPFAQLLRYIDRLPEHSHYVAAVLASDEFADQAASEMEANRGRPHRAQLPSRVGWDPTVAKLADLIDVVRELAVITAYRESNKKAPDLKPGPRPLDPYERALRRAEEARHFARVQLLTPGR